MHQENPIINGHITKALISISMPLLASMVLQSLFHLVDTFWVGKISADAVAAVSTVFPFIFILISLSLGLSVGLAALIAYSYGKKDLKKVSSVINNAMIIGVFLSIFYVVIGFIFGKEILVLIGARTFLAEALSYFNPFLVGTPILVLSFICQGIWRGMGKTKVIMNSMIVANILNFFLDPLFIFVFNWGISGVSWATVISRTFATLILLWPLIKKNTIRLHVSPTFDRSVIKQLAYFGAPFAFVRILEAVSWSFIIKLLSDFGSPVLAAYGIVFRLEGFIVLPIAGFSSGLITVISQNLGAGKIKRARKSVFITLVLGVLLSLVLGLVIIAAPSPWIKVFNTNPEVVEHGSRFLTLSALFFVFIAAEEIFKSAFQGFGALKVVMVMSIVKSILRILLSLILRVPFQMIGVWYGYLLSIALVSFIDFFIFLKLKENIKVFEH